MPGPGSKVYEHPEVSDFYHVVVADTLAGQAGIHGRLPARPATTVLRARGAATAPLVLRAELIDEGVGPSNVHVMHEEGRDMHGLVPTAKRPKWPCTSVT
jgi:hypothetical protein